MIVKRSLPFEFVVTCLITLFCNDRDFKKIAFGDNLRFSHPLALFPKETGGIGEILYFPMQEQTDTNR